MRARSAKQRFAVAKWVEDLELLQDDAIRIHQRELLSTKAFDKGSGVSDPSFELLAFRTGELSIERLSMYEENGPEDDAVGSEETVQSKAAGPGRTLSLGSRAGPGHRLIRGNVRRLSRVGEGDEEEAEVEISREDAEAAVNNGALTGRIDNVAEALRRLEGLDWCLPHAIHATVDAPNKFDVPRGRGRDRARTNQVSICVSSPGGTEQRPIDLTADDDRSRSPSPMARTSLLPNDTRDTSSRTLKARQSSASLLSLSEVTLGRSDYNLQKVKLNFTDITGEYYDKFQSMLTKKLDAKSSESTLVIEDYLKESEKEWAANYRAAKLGRARTPSPAPPSRHYSSPARSHGGSRRNGSSDDGTAYAGSVTDESLLGKDHIRPSLLKRCMQTSIFDWPIYSIFLAIGQIIAASSYQIVLLTGGPGGGAAEDTKLYVVGVIYIIASCLWWTMYRRMTPRYVMSVPFRLYGLTFILVGLAAFVPWVGGRDRTRSEATGLYTTASVSGSLFLALNFGDEGGAPMKSWVYRASLVQGLQQIYILALYYWGSVMSNATRTGQSAPGKIPNFYHSLLRRRLIIWMLVSVVLQNCFLSTPYGRNWAYVWSSSYAPEWAIAHMALFFFIGVWTAILVLFAHLSKSHSWILPMFAFCLLARRWAQMWWATASFGLWIPWMPGGPVAGAIAGRSLWLGWGVLDAVQGVGIGVALLQTLTRMHVAVVLTASQVLGATVTSDCESFSA
nr:hypothetical protein B0A51_00918 [Rachicladosporium sp. CCFEE 5018]